MKLSLLHSFDDRGTKRRVWVLEFSRNSTFQFDHDTLPQKPFVTMIWSCADSVTDDQMHVLAKVLVEKECRYFVCGGKQCGAWEWATDLAHVDRSIREHWTNKEWENFKTMTTSHDQESVEDVLEFALNSTNFDDHDFTDFLFVIIDGDQSFIDELSGKIRSMTELNHDIN